MKIWVEIHVPYGYADSGWDWIRVPVGPLQPGKGRITRAVRTWLRQNTEVDKFRLLVNVEPIPMRPGSRREYVRFVPGPTRQVWS